MLRPMTDVSYWLEKAEEYLRLAAECEADYPALATQYRALADAYSATLNEIDPQPPVE
jgi:hypothetical protein